MIQRSLDGGWDYKVDWRAAVVDERLRENPHAPLGRLLAGEPDLVVRHALRFKMTGKGAAAEAMGYVYRCHENRRHNLAAATISAMVVAGSGRQEIAKQLGTTPLNIFVFEQMFFDVRRFAGNRQWLATIAKPTSPANPLDPVAVRERSLLGTAFHRGAPGLEQLITGTLPKPAELESMMQTIRAALTMKAAEFVLERSVAAANADDLTRLVEFARLPARGDSSKQEERLQEFGRKIRQAVMKKAEEGAGDSSQSGFRPAQPSAPADAFSAS